MSPSLLRKVILAELAEAPAEGLTQTGLLMLVQQHAPKTAMADLRDELAWLRDRTLAAFVADEFDQGNLDARTWTITTAGRLHLLKK
ncbi:MAG: hypothetical protein H7067_08180 [Burkholderiales bacterium]|nr:hypothetical protein [Opitutaceae bacterium]